MSQKNIDTNPTLAKAQAVLEEYDTESRFHKFTAGSAIATVIKVLAVVSSIFHLYTAYVGALPALQQRSIHLGFMLTLAFLLYPARRGGKLTVWDAVLALLGSATAGYILWDYHALALRFVQPNTLDIIMAGVAVLLVLEASRRVAGKEITILAIVFLLYAYFGPYMPGMLGHRGYGVREILQFMYLTTEGIYGIAIGVSATFIVLFIIFGAFLEKTGMGELFNNLALGLTGSSAGGPAKVAVVSSAFLGSINGSAVANVVTTGAFTIPLMKRSGYHPEFAGAVEAAASVGGQILPPVMGAAAFIMAETLGVPYGQIALAAAVPALLYFFGVGTTVHLRAKKQGLKGVPANELPRVGEVMRKGGHMFIPLIALVYMLISGYSATRAAFLAIVLIVVVSFLRKETRLSIRGTLDALEFGTRNAISVAVVCGVVGLVVGVAAQTGLAVRLASTIISVAGGNLMLTLVLAMFASLILGMGIPSIPCYIITATMAAPALAVLGVPHLVAHMFVFYFGVMANLTPPVALAAFAGAGMAGANPNRTGYAALKLALAGFVVPFMFVYSPAILLKGTLGEILWVSATAIVGVIALAAAAEGWLMTGANLVERILLAGSAVLLILPLYVADASGLTMIAAVWIWQRHRSQTQAPSALPQ